MNRSATMLQGSSGGWDEGLSWAVGAGFTFVLFVGMAHFEHTGTPAPEIEELHVAALPYDQPPPPPRPVETTPVPEESTPLIGVDAERSDSPVQIRVLPPDFAALLPQAQLPAKYLDSLGRQQIDLKPRAEFEFDDRHVFQPSEVDVQPLAISRPMPRVTGDVFGNASFLRAEFILTIGRDGQVEAIQLVSSSGKPAFDKIVAQTLREEWEFSAAVRRGKRVRCLAQQSVRITLSSGGSPFDVR